MGYTRRNKDLIIHCHPRTREVKKSPDKEKPTSKRVLYVTSSTFIRNTMRSHIGSAGDDNFVVVAFKDRMLALKPFDIVLYDSGIIGNPGYEHEQYWFDNVVACRKRQGCLTIEVGKTPEVLPKEQADLYNKCQEEYEEALGQLAKIETFKIDLNSPTSKCTDPRDSEPGVFKPKEPIEVPDWLQQIISKAAKERRAKDKARYVKGETDE